jgi:branched-chain amino acid transport system ATP-binding protein
MISRSDLIRGDGGAAARQSKVPILQIQGLYKSFGGLPATQDVSLSLQEGERRLLIGPNGAGKTTLFNQITGELKPSAGSIRFDGREISTLPPHRRAHLGIARTYQIITLFRHDTLERNVALALLGLMRARWDMLRPLGARPEILEEARRVLGLVGLSHAAHLPAGTLAYGEQRRLEIALALAQKPRLLLLDEPLAGLSAEERASVKQLVAGIPRDVTVAMIEHDMDTALDLADTITLLHHGRVIVDGTRQQVLDDARTREVYLGY